jgi:hypothetical protein
MQCMSERPPSCLADTHALVDGIRDLCTALHAISDSVTVHESTLGINVFTKYSIFRAVKSRIEIRLLSFLD